MCQPPCRDGCRILKRVATGSGVQGCDWLLLAWHTALHAMTKSAVVPHGQGEETQQERTDGADPTKALPRSGSVSGDHAILRTITTVLQRVQVVDSWSGT